MMMNNLNYREREKEKERKNSIANSETFAFPVQPME